MVHTIRVYQVEVILLCLLDTGSVPIGIETHIFCRIIKSSH